MNLDSPMAMTVYIRTRLAAREFERSCRLQIKERIRLSICNLQSAIRNCNSL